MIRLPKPGGDDGSWGDILNAYLEISLNPDGTIKDNIVTNAKLDSSLQGSIDKAETSEQTTSKDQANGYAGLDGSGLIKSAELPASLVTATGATTGYVPVANGSNGYAWGNANGYATAEYVVTKNGSTITATPLNGSGLTPYSGTSAYTVIQSAITALTPTGGGTGSGGGKIYITKGQYNINDELTITGWEGAVDNPLSQLIIQGDGFATQLIQTTTGKNGLVVKNGACFVLRDIRIYSGNNSKSALLLDDNGADIDLSCEKSVIDNVHLDSNSTSYPTALFKNFFDLSVPTLHVNSSSNDALSIQNTSATTNYGNSNFGYLRCTAGTSGSFAGLRVVTTSSTTFMNLLTFSNYEINCHCAYGIYAKGMWYSSFNFVDIEGTTNPVYFDGASTSFTYETRYNSIKAGFLLPSGNNTAITCTLYTGGNDFSPALSATSTAAPFVDSSNFRPVNNWDVVLSTTSASIPLISVTNPKTPVRIRRNDGNIQTPAAIRNLQTGSYTLVLTDENAYVDMNSASATVLTVPPNSSVPFLVGTIIQISRLGSGSVTITPGVGVTLPNRLDSAGTGSRTISAQYGNATIRKIATDQWLLTGSDLS